jgi:hypothetical protein
VAVQRDVCKFNHCIHTVTSLSPVFRVSHEAHLAWLPRRIDWKYTFHVNGPGRDNIKTQRTKVRLMFAWTRQLQILGSSVAHRAAQFSIKEGYR